MVNDNYEPIDHWTTKKEVHYNLQNGDFFHSERGLDDSEVPQWVYYKIYIQTPDGKKYLAGGTMKQNLERQGVEA